MRAAVRASALVFIGGSLAACAALTGLDGIEENRCYPDLCEDAAPDVTHAGDSAAPEAGADAVAETAADVQDAAPAMDALDERATPDDAPDGADAGDSGLPADVGPDAPLEATADAPADAPHDAVATPDAAEACAGTVYFSDSFANNANGWTLDTTWSIAKECATPPAPQKGNPDPTTDHTGTDGSGVVGAYVCGNNPTGATTSFRYATSPAFDTSSAGTLTLGFWRWLNSDASGWMTSTVDVYDGAAWINVYTNPSSTTALETDAAWTYEAYDVTPQKNAAFRVRFGYAILDAGVYEMSAWNVDDVVVSSPPCGQ